MNESTENHLVTVLRVKFLQIVVVTNTLTSPDAAVSKGETVCDGVALHGSLEHKSPHLSAA
jgi:hypothetical protein